MVETVDARMFCQSNEFLDRGTKISKSDCLNFELCDG